MGWPKLSRRCWAVQRGSNALVAFQQAQHMLFNMFWGLIRRDNMFWGLIRCEMF